MGKSNSKEERGVKPTKFSTTEPQKSPTKPQPTTTAPQQSPTTPQPTSTAPQVTEQPTAKQPESAQPATVQPATVQVPEMSDNMVEAVVCMKDDLKDGEMKEVEVGDAKALLVRTKGEYSAIGAKCSHYGAPLIKGVFCNGRVRCPWHGACFNVKTGDIEEYPGLDSVPKFNVEVCSNGEVKIRADKTSLKQFRRIKDMCAGAGDDRRTFLIIGGGPASVACVETLRQEGFKGRLIIATMERHLPYDRIKLSKAMDSKAENIALRSAEFYKEHDIEVQVNKQAVEVDLDGSTVKFADNTTQKYDRLLLATGARPRKLPVPDVDLTNVCLLRTPEDANYIAAQAPGKNIVIVGSSFIGMEVASYLADKAASVTVVDIIKLPFELVLGRIVGRVLQKLHEEKGVKFHFQTGLSEIVGEGKVEEVVLSNGTRLPADICILGVGVAPATEFVRGSALEMNRQGFVKVDDCMKTNIENVFAAGDITEFPLFTCNSNVCIGHWQMAHHHGRVAAYSMLGQCKPIRSVPYFWTVMYGKSVRYTGYGAGFDDIIIHGNPDEQKFVAYYTKGDDVIAAASLNFDPIISQIAEMFTAALTIRKEEIMTDPYGWLPRLPKV